MFFRFLAEHCEQVEKADDCVCMQTQYTVHIVQAASGSDRVLTRRIRLSEVTALIRLH